jgi:crotonobetainyl-CoA:carnitine CoA-transferase CaiB-like acyl-CoA transferase
MTTATGTAFNMHGSSTGEMYNAYLTEDGKPFLMAALEQKFWEAFCHGVGREDLVPLRDAHAQIHFGWDDTRLHRELADIFATATADEWDRRFLEWDVPGSRILEIPEVMELEHFAARGILEGEPGSWPNITSAIRWHHTGERAGAGLAPPPHMGAHGDEVLAEWLHR